MARKIESYWTLRRNMRSRVSGHLADLQNIQNATVGTDQNETLRDLDNIANSVEYIEPRNQSVQVINQNMESESDSQRQLDLHQSFYLSEDDHDSDTAHIASDDNMIHPNNIFSSSDSGSDNEDKMTMSQKLREWSTTFQIPNMALLSLLDILKPHFPELPKDPRTLLQTQTTYNLSEIGGGQYYHFGIVSSISQKVEPCLRFLENEYSFALQINIDGLPLFKSTNDQFWPILGRIRNITDDSPFVIGLFSGQSKPNNLNNYLQNFIEEYKEIQENGLDIHGKHFSVAIDSFICDTPARAFVKCVKGHSGYSGCDKCTQSGVHLGKMTFPETNAPIRTDPSFDSLSDEEHHKGISPLAEINVGMVTQFPIDYMHLVCLGVVKRLLLLWLRGPLKCRLGSQDVNKISESLLSLKNYIPCEFSRKPRSLDVIDRWKATEFRQFLLYTGPLVLLQVVHNNLYKNFMLLSVAIHILLNDRLCEMYCSFAHDLLVAFVTHFGQIYGKDMLVYNVHGLVHLSADASKYGNLDNVSSFPFENFLGRLKRMVRKPSFPLQQIIRRLSEEKNTQGTKTPEKHYPVLRKQHKIGPLPPCLSNGIQYGSVATPKFSIKLNQKDSCVRVGGQIGVVKNIILDDADTYVVYQPFKYSEDFFDIPVPSGFLGIQTVHDLGTTESVCKLSDIQAKCTLLPHKRKYLAIPFTSTIWSMYAVVEFTDEGSVAVVPKTWLTDDKKKCKWPMWTNVDKINHAVKQSMEPTPSFMCLSIRVLYESDDYEKARKRLSRAEVTSNLESDQADEETDTVPKRKKRPNPRYDPLSSESEEENECNISQDKTSGSLRRSPRKSKKQFPDPPPLPALPSLASPARKAPSTPSTKATSSLTSSPTSSKSALDSTPNQQMTATNIKILTILEDVKGQVRFNTKLLQNILAKVEVTGTTTTTMENEVDIGIEFPLKTQEELDSLEEQLESQETTKIMLGKLICIGGDNVQTCVRRVLSFLMATSLATQLNWSGKGSKRGLSSLKLKDIIIKAVRKNKFCSAATDNEIERLVKDWLRYAKDRDGGRRKREEKKKEKERDSEEASQD